MSPHVRSRPVKVGQRPGLLTAYDLDGTRVVRSYVRLVCAAEALHSDNLAPWLADDDGRTLVKELVQQGSLEFADE